MKVAQVKIGWLSSDSVRGTIDVFGSVSQYQAPIDVLIDIIVKTTVTNELVNSCVCV